MMVVLIAHYNFMNFLKDVIDAKESKKSWYMDASDYEKVKSLS